LLPALLIKANDRVLIRIEDEDITIGRSGDSDRPPLCTSIGSISPGIEEGLPCRRTVGGIDTPDRECLLVLPASREPLDAAVSAIRDKNLQPVRRVHVKRLVKRPRLSPPSAEGDLRASVDRQNRNRAPLRIDHVEPVVRIGAKSMGCGERSHLFDIPLEDRG